jgi:type II secretory ATPase GspE/PulE/Tfp pilus assembly ATPase PilB-like protein
MTEKPKISQVAPRTTYKNRYEYLISHKIITDATLKKARVTAPQKKKSIEYVLMTSFSVKKADIGKSLSLFYNCPFQDFDPDIHVPFELINSLKKAYLQHDLWVPLSWDKNGVVIIIDNPKNLDKTDRIQALIKVKEIKYVVGFDEDIQSYIKHFFEQNEKNPVDDMLAGLDMIQDIDFEEETVAEPEQDLFDESSSQLVKLVDQVLVTAYRRNVSDIHIEPQPLTGRVDIRFRIDGVCHEYMQVPNSMAPALMSRLKIMGDLDISEKRLPQDGKISFKRKGIDAFELRLATIPTNNGFEDAVLRVLAKAGAMSLDIMGIPKEKLEAFKILIQQPYGMILVVGPTGSGKTTTLHAAVGHINKPNIKIWTAEDPIEITQLGLRQVQVKPKIGYTFERVLRSFLRADPDVILIGEMRDKETAQIGVEASLTGHMVFSTLHTNSAPETLTRLIDMGINRLNFSDVLLCVLAQRLVRRLCDKCKKPYTLSDELLLDIASDYGTELFHEIEEKMGEEIILYQPVGCDKCGDTGYKGRLGIFEMLEGTPEIKRMIKKPETTTEEIVEQAMKDGMRTLKQDGIFKVFQGFTDLSEVRRVCTSI